MPEPRTVVTWEGQGEPIILKVQAGRDRGTVRDDPDITVSVLVLKLAWLEPGTLGRDGGHNSIGHRRTRLPCPAPAGPFL